MAIGATIPLLQTCVLYRILREASFALIMITQPVTFCDLLMMSHATPGVMMSHATPGGMMGHATPGVGAQRAPPSMARVAIRWRLLRPYRGIRRHHHGCKAKAFALVGVVPIYGSKCFGLTTDDHRYLRTLGRYISMAL